MLGDTQRSILEAVSEEPKSWSDLLNMAKVSEVSLYRHLMKLQAKDLMKKLPGGSYGLTEAGAKLLNQQEAIWEIMRENLVVQSSQHLDMLESRMGKFYAKVAQKFGESKVDETSAVFNFVDVQALRDFYTDGLNLGRDEVDKVERLVGSILQRNPSMSRFVLVLAFDPERAVDDGISMSGRNVGPKERAQLVTWLRGIWMGKPKV